MKKKNDNQAQLQMTLDAPLPPPAPAAEAREKNNAAPPAAPSSGSPAANPAPVPPPPRKSAAELAIEAQGPLKRMVDGNFMQYASYVIRDRAIPNLDDGLKPVQRRILWSLHEKDDGKFIKVANIVGYCMQYHPHGDASIGEALVSLANRQYLIEGQGNFGNIFTGDPAAAARYIECRLTELARRELFHDALTEFVPSYDGRNREPVTLPAKIPLLLMLGAEGIAVGLSTRIFPHNFGELLEAQIAILQKKPFRVLPDFPQGGLMDVSEYDLGRGRIRLRAVIDARDEHTLVIREIPHGTTTEALIASIEDAARKKKLKIRSISDYTAEKIEIAVALAPGESAEKTVQALYAFTACEQSLSSNIVVIRDRRPAEMNVEEILRYQTQRLVGLLDRELQLRRRNLQEDLHAKTLAQLFVEERIYKKIENCKTWPDVQQAVLKGVNAFRDRLRRDVTPDDVDKLLELRIRRISQFDIEKNRRDMEAIVTELAEVEKNLKGLTAYAVRYLKELHKNYAAASPRRTRVKRFEEVELRALTARELKVQYDRANGYLGHAVAGEEAIECSSYDKLIVVWNDGRYKLLPPPEKLFVDKDVVYWGRYDRDRVMTAVYTADGVSYLKRFTFGGAIMNKDYALAPEGARVPFFSDADPEELYVVYAPAKHQRINQQIFHPREVGVRNAKSRGNQLTTKKIKNCGASKPRNWDDAAESPPGALI